MTPLQAMDAYPISRQRRNLNLLIGMAATLLPLALIIAGVVRFTGGVFIYPVDDTFIHMEVARHLAADGTWGMNAGEFGSASSSLLYTLLLALLFKLFSVHTLIPLIVNTAAGIALLVAINNWLAKQKLKANTQLAILLAVVFFTPLPVLILSGMEHVLQCLFSFLFLVHTADWFGKKKGSWQLPLYALLVVATRYEGLFLVGMFGIVLLWKRQMGTALKIGVAALLPVVIFGLWSMSKGSYFLPNSVLIKSDEVPLFGAGIGHFMEAILVDKLTLAKPGITALAAQRLLLLLPLTFLAFRKQLKHDPQLSLPLIVLTGCTVLHLAFASTGKFYRYEAYLICCTVAIVGAVAGMSLPKPSIKNGTTWALAAVLCFFIFFPLFLRSTAAFTKAKQACINIYEQQYQMAQFLKAHYPQSAFAANDIGAVSFFTSGYVVDLWGLGSIDIAKSRKRGAWTGDFLDSICRQKGAKLAIIYDSWFRDTPAKHWQKIAIWQIQNNVVCGDDTVSFYAMDAAAAPQLRAALLQYGARLPAGVTVHYEPELPHE